MAWLERRTKNRSVRLLIGNYRTKYFNESTPENRDDALAFLARDDVEVLGWYRRHGQRSEAHWKVWIAESGTDPPAVLNGSANLTEVGLYHNHELMTSVTEKEVKQAVRQVKGLLDKAWDIKSKIRGHIQGRAESIGPRRGYKPSRPVEASTRTGHRRSPETRPRPPYRTGRRKSVGRGCSGLIIGLLTLMALLYLLNIIVPSLNSTNNNADSRDTLPGIAGGVEGTQANTVTVTPTTLKSSASSVQTEQADSQVSITTSQEVTLTLDSLTADYVQGIVEAQAGLEKVLVSIRAVNRDWDNRNETGLVYAEAEATLIAIKDQVQTLYDNVRYQRVPIVLRGVHGRPEGPVQQAAKLPPLAEAVLVSLQIPAPNDGTERRTALRELDSAVQDFFNSAEHVLKHVDKNAEALGLTNSPASTTTTHPPAPLTDEGVSYVEGLMKFKETLAHLVTELNAANEAWDSRATTNVSFSQTESAIGSVADRAQALHEQLRDFPVPQPVRVLGEDPPRKAAAIAESASRVLSGLRIPAPDPGFERLAALDDFNAAAELFEHSLNHVISEVFAKAHTSGLAKES